MLICEGYNNPNLIKLIIFAKLLQEIKCEINFHPGPVGWCSYDVPV